MPKENPPVKDYLQAGNLAESIRRGVFGEVRLFITPTTYCSPDYYHASARAIDASCHLFNLRYGFLRTRVLFAFLLHSVQ